MTYRDKTTAASFEEPLRLDEGGGVIPFPPQRWLLGFVPALNDNWWHRFVHRRHVHVFALRHVEGDRWLVLEPWWARTPIRVTSYADARRFLRWATMGDMLRVREETPGRSSQLRGMMTCAALMAHMLGRPYQVFTPNALYRRLNAEPGTERIDAASLIRRFDRQGRTGPRDAEPLIIDGTAHVA